MVASIAISPTLSITESRIGPRSDRRPTDAREIVCSVDWAMFSATLETRRAFPIGGLLRKDAALGRFGSRHSPC